MLIYTYVGMYVGSMTLIDVCFRYAHNKSILWRLNVFRVNEKGERVEKLSRALRA